MEKMTSWTDEVLEQSRRATSVMLIDLLQVNSLVLMSKLGRNTAGPYHHIIYALITIYWVQQISALHCMQDTSLLTITMAATPAPKTVIFQFLHPRIYIVAAAGKWKGTSQQSCVCPYACARGWVVGCADAGIYLALITNVLGCRPIQSLMMASICEEKSPESNMCAMVCVCVRVSVCIFVILVRWSWSWCRREEENWQRTIEADRCKIDKKLLVRFQDETVQLAEITTRMKNRMPEK